MTTEKLRITGFAGLETAELDLGRLNLFIGPQASGKSIAVKLLYFVKSFYEDAINAIGQGIEFQSFDRQRTVKLDRLFPVAFRSANGFEFDYSLNGCRMVVNGGRKQPITVDAPAWERLYKDAERACREARESLGQNSMDARLAVYSIYEDRFQRPAPTPQVFVADGRGGQPFFEELLKSATINAQDLGDPFMVEYQKVYAWASRYLAKNVPDWWDDYANELYPVLRGTPVERDGETYIRSPDGRDVLLGFASSGQKEVFPIIKLLAFLASLGVEQSEPNLYLEEPEAHLYPESQAILIGMIAAVLRRKRTIQTFITTHSPYVAAALNNLLYAGQLGADANRRARVAAVVPESHWLSGSEFRAFMFEEGRVTNAVDSETGLFQADLLDRASDHIGGVFDHLLELDDRR